MSRKILAKGILLEGVLFFLVAKRWMIFVLFNPKAHPFKPALLI